MWEFYLVFGLDATINCIFFNLFLGKLAALKGLAPLSLSPNHWGCGGIMYLSGLGDCLTC